MKITIDGQSLTVEQVIEVTRNGAKVEICQDAQVLINRSRDYVDTKLSEKAIIYGLTTGFGKFSDRMISTEDSVALQKKLIMSHACSMGNPLPTEIVRGVMLMRCNALSSGFSGIRLSTIQTLLDMLNSGVHPIIPEKGSLGASGDLAPLSHMVLVMMGMGEAEYKGERMTGAQAMKQAGIEPVVLAAKEGLALINGTQVMASIGTHLVYDTEILLKTADISAAMTCEAQLGITSAYDEKVHAVRRQPGQIACAANMRKLLVDSQYALVEQFTKLQDAYAVRCVPQIHGASRAAFDYVRSVISNELNAVTDNPIIFCEHDQIISGGNFHGQPLAIALDTLGIAVAELADVAERRLERLVNPQLSFDLPAFLTKHGGLNSGFMIAQYSAASMVSENKVLAHPASVDSIPSSANQEDHVSMGTTAARKAATILDNVQKVIGIELMAAAQALWLRGEEGIAPATREAYNIIREQIPPIYEDVVMYPLLDKADKIVKSGCLVPAVEAVCGKLN